MESDFFPEQNYPNFEQMLEMATSEHSIMTFKPLNISPQLIKGWTAPTAGLLHSKAFGSANPTFEQWGPELQNPLVHGHYKYKQHTAK